MSNIQRDVRELSTAGGMLAILLDGANGIHVFAMTSSSAAEDSPTLALYTVIAPRGVAILSMQKDALAQFVTESVVAAAESGTDEPEGALTSASAADATIECPADQCNRDGCCCIASIAGRSCQGCASSDGAILSVTCNDESNQGSTGATFEGNSAAVDDPSPCIACMVVCGIVCGSPLNLPCWAGCSAACCAIL